MIYNHGIFECSNRSPLYRRLIQCKLQPGDFIPFTYHDLSFFHENMRDIPIKVRMANYMRKLGYSERDIFKITDPAAYQRYMRNMRRYTTDSPEQSAEI